MTQIYRDSLGQGMHRNDEIVGGSLKNEYFLCVNETAKVLIHYILKASKS